MIDPKKIMLFSFLFAMNCTPGFATSGITCDDEYLWCSEQVCADPTSRIYSQCMKNCKDKKDKCISKAKCDAKYEKCTNECTEKGSKTDCYDTCKKTHKKCKKKADKDS